MRRVLLILAALTLCAAPPSSRAADADARFAAAVAAAEADDHETAKRELDGLVEDGTLTQAQRDTVEERLLEARPHRGALCVEGVEGAALGEALDHPAIHPPGVDPLTEVEQVAVEALATGLDDRLDRALPHVLDP